jgi:hypothetical protein
MNRSNSGSKLRLTREEKVKFLRSLAAGKPFADVLPPLTISLIEFQLGGPLVDLLNGAYVDPDRLKEYCDRLKAKFPFRKLSIVTVAYDQLKKISDELEAEV